MKIITACSPNYTSILSKCFLSSLKDGCEVCIHYLPEDKRLDSLKLKTSVICECDTPTIFSDCDIAFFDKIIPDIQERLKNFDIVCQNNNVQNTFYNTGFFAFNPTPTVSRLLKTWRRQVCNQNNDDKFTTIDEIIFNDLIRQAEVKHAPLPISYWSPHLQAIIPKKIKIAHAIYCCSTVGIKIPQLKTYQLTKENFLLTMIRHFDKKLINYA